MYRFLSFVSTPPRTYQSRTSEENFKGRKEEDRHSEEYVLAIDEEVADDVLPFHPAKGMDAAMRIENTRDQGEDHDEGHEAGTPRDYEGPEDEIEGQEKPAGILGTDHHRDGPHVGKGIAVPVTDIGNRGGGDHVGKEEDHADPGLHPG